MDWGLLTGILAALSGVALVVFIIIWYRKAKAQALDIVKKKMRRNRQRKLLGPESGNYSGAKHTFGKVRCDGVMGLTSSNLYFQKLVGKSLEISIDRVVSVAIEKWFLGHRKGGLPHLVLDTEDGNRIGFQLRKYSQWQETLQKLLDTRKS